MVLKDVSESASHICCASAFWRSASTLAIFLDRFTPLGAGPATVLGSGGGLYAGVRGAGTSSSDDSAAAAFFALGGGPDERLTGAGSSSSENCSRFDAVRRIGDGRAFGFGGGSSSENVSVSGRFAGAARRADGGSSSSENVSRFGGFRFTGAGSSSSENVSRFDADRIIGAGRFGFGAE